MSGQEEDVTDALSSMELLERAKKEFDRDKRLIIKNLPPETLEKDVQDLLDDFGTLDLVQFQKNNTQAIVTLEDRSKIDVAVAKLNGTTVGERTVTLSVHRSEILCIAQLPLTYTEKQFKELATEHGKADMCFLMRSEETGESKGYGFVTYDEPIERIGKTKLDLDWAEVEGHALHCDALVNTSDAPLTFQNLHSTCLLIDNLPTDYNDSIALRELFSEIVKPLYCQIVTKEGESLGFGIVEFNSGNDAEKAFTKFNGHKVNDVAMSISYCIPGKSAVHMFGRVMYKYGDRVQINKASLLPDPVYPNPAFLKHVFFKTHVAKHPRLLVQFTDNLLHLQEGYVRQLEDKTNAKPGILGPPPVIPMSPLMDINLQLGLLSIIVLDMREKGTYNGEVPDPLGKVKVPSAEEVESKEEKTEPVSLLGDPMTAQANLIVKNLLRPPDATAEGMEPKSPPPEDEPKLLGKAVRDLNLVCLCSLGRLMAMLTEKNQAMGILGTGPGSVKPLMEGLMQAGKVAQKLLESMGMGRSQGQQGNQNFGNQGNLGQNTATSAANLLGTIQQLAMQKMAQTSPGSGNKIDVKSLFSGNQNNDGNSGDGLLGNYQGQGQGQGWLQSQMKNQGKGPQSLMSLNLNSKGDGLMPAPKGDDSSGYGFHGNQGGYDDSGYQGGYDDSGYGEGYGGGNYDNTGFGNYGDQMTPRMGSRGSGNRMDQDYSQNYDAYFTSSNSSQRTGPGQGMNKTSDRREGNYSDIAQRAAMYAAGAAAAYRQQYDNWMQSGYGGGYSNDGRYSGYGGGYNTGGAQQGYGGGYNSGDQYGMGGGWQGDYGGDMSYGNQQNAYGNQGNKFGQQGGTMRSQYSASPVSYQQQNTQRNPQGMQQGTNFPGSYGGQNMGMGNGPRGPMGPPQNFPNLGGTSWGSAASQANQATPQGQKRPFSHILPSPEPSPEGDYVGQHSQGIGGHYADSYTKRQKLEGRF